MEPEVTAAESKPGDASLTELQANPLLFGQSMSWPLVATVVAFDESGSPMVDMPDVMPGRLVSARSTVPLPPGRCEGVIVLLERGDPLRPIVVGVIQPAGIERQPEAAKSVAVSVDGRALQITAQRELVLRCGHASITLTAAGKVLVDGRYVVSRSSGANRIKGAVVDIN